MARIEVVGIPALRCQVCGEQLYDLDVLARIESALRRRVAQGDMRTWYTFEQLAASGGPAMNSTILHLSGIGEIPISVAEGSAAQVSLTGRQALALLRILERNRAALEREAEAERDREYGRGPGTHAAEVPQKIRKGDPRLGKRAITYGDHLLMAR